MKAHLTDTRSASWIAGTGALALLGAVVLVHAVRAAAAAYSVTPELWPEMPPPETSTATLARAGRSAPGVASYHFFLARALHERARTGGPAAGVPATLTRAVHHAERAVALIPSNGRYRLLAGAILVTQILDNEPDDTGRRLGTAVQRLTEARERNPVSAAGHERAGLELARAWPLLGTDARALVFDALRAAAALEPQRSASSLAALLDTRGEAWTLGHLARFVPDHPEAWHAAATALERRHDDPASATTGARTATLSVYERAAESGNLDARSMQAWLAAWQRLAPDDPQALVAAASRLRERHRRRAPAWTALGIAQDRAGEPDAARATFDAAVQLARSSAGSDGTPEELAIALRERAEHDFRREGCATALRDYEELLRIDGNVFWQIRKGQCLDVLDRPDEALGAYRAAVQRDAESTAARSMLALALLDRGQPLEAIGQWRRVLRRDHGSLDARLGIARSYELLAQYEQALATYREILQLQPDNTDARAALDRLAGSLQR